MTKRRKIAKKTRFEVFKRDKFICQYCGNKAPDVVLEIDHIDPVSEGGSNKITNLLTSCYECNRGKGKNKLSDNSVITKKRKQIELLEDRRQQLKMLHDWELEVLEIDKVAVQSLSDYIGKLSGGYSLNEYGLNEIRKLRKKFSDKEIMEAIKVSTDHYLKYNEKGEITDESFNVACSKISGICYIKKKEQADPDIKKVYLIKGILKNRLHYFNERMFWMYIKRARGLDIDLDNAIEVAKTTNSWTQWRDGIESFLQKYGGENDI